MNEESFRLYKVVETADMTAEELQNVLNEATEDVREMQIDYVVGTKLILGFESWLNSTGRQTARLAKQLETVANTMESGY